MIPDTLRSLAVPVDAIQPHPRNARKHDDAAIKASLQAHGQYKPLTVQQSTGYILAGNGTYYNMMALGATEVAATYMDVDDEEATRIVLVDNRSNDLSPGYDEEALVALLQELPDLDGTGYDEEALDALVASVAGEASAQGGDSPDAGDQSTDAAPSVTLADRFIVPPFSVLDARQGYWQARKRDWLALGIKSELGRGENAAPGGSSRDATTLDPNGKTQRGDGTGRTLGAVPPNERSSIDRSGPYATGNSSNGLLGFSERARSHYRGDRLTWVAGDRSPDAMDETSRKNLAGGRRASGAADTKGSGGPGTTQAKYNARPPHGATVTQNPDGTQAYRPTNSEDGMQGGTSIFDPVLCELAYRWFCPPTGTILDPFAGGSVRGIVASQCGRQYVGIDLRPEQVDANRVQADDMCHDPMPVWHAGDSRYLPALCGDVDADLVFTCPPYYDLEVYSDDPADLSNAGDYGSFMALYREIIRLAIGRLKDDRFACVVVGDIRDKRGLYRNFVSDTIDAFQAAGALLYNEAILVTAVGSLPIRVGRQFAAGRKLGKTHQNVLVFIKGDPKRAVEACGPVEVAVPDDPDGDTALIATDQVIVSDAERLTQLAEV